jgi:hypothetical protein
MLSKKILSKERLKAGRRINGYTAGIYINNRDPDPPSDDVPLMFVSSIVKGEVMAPRFPRAG